MRIHVIGGGTFSPVRNHLALSSPAFGTTARYLEKRLVSRLREPDQIDPYRLDPSFDVLLHLTKMADPASPLVTNDDVSAFLDRLIDDPQTRVIILNAALCDYDGSIIEANLPTESGLHAPRLKTAEGGQIMRLTPASKLVGKIRRERKDILAVAFKTTTGATSDEQYAIALNMLKRDSLNLVLANDTVTRNNMIVAPEETRYHETPDRNAALDGLVEMILARSRNTFTRSTVVDGDSVSWDDPRIPENLRTVVNYCIEQGAYKTVRGVTAGHFAVKLDDRTILTSKRKQDFNRLAEIGLVQVEYEGDDKVVAYGAKPSVGGQSQRIVFREHPGLDCIVHFHCPLKEEPADMVPTVPQWQNECGSHQCGQNTSRGLKDMSGFGGHLKAVMLDGHGPNIVFSHEVPARDIIAFIEANFDLSQKTGGLVAA